MALRHERFKVGKSSFPLEKFALPGPWVPAFAGKTTKNRGNFTASEDELRQIGVLGEGADLVAYIVAVDRDERAFGPVGGGEADLL